MAQVNYKGALPQGTALKQGKYIVRKVLGTGGFGITYRVDGYVGNIKMRFAIKEFFIPSMCQREGNMMQYSDAVKPDVEAGMKSFMAEARRLNDLKIKQDNIVTVNEVFKENNTVYYVMEYIDGKNIREFVSGNGINEDSAKQFLAPIMKAVAELHTMKVTHQDIKPDNIILSSEEGEDYECRPVLIDFGLAKHYDSKGHVTSKLNFAACSPGYAPNEQYQDGGMTEFTPQADVYSLAATMLFMLTGKDPVVASAMTKDKLESLFPPMLSEQMKTALRKALKQDKSERTQSVEQLAEDMGISLTTFSDSNKTVFIGSQTSGAAASIGSSIKGKGKYIGMAAAVAAVAGIAVWLFPLLSEPSASNNEPSKDTTETKTEQVDSVKQPTATASQKEEVGTPAAEATPVVSQPSTNAKTSEASKPTDVKTPKAEKAEQPSVKNGVLQLGAATWRGGIMGGKPHGDGTMTYNASTSVHGHTAEAGYTLKGTYENGRLSFGELRDANGVKVATIIP